MIRTLVSNESKPRILGLFLLVIVGILANWFWDIGWTYLGDPAAGMDFGSLQVILVRVALSFIAAGLTFIPTYNKIGQNTGNSWVPYFIAFQNGFFWEAALDAIL